MYAVGGEEVQMNFDVLHSIRGVGAEDIFAWGGDRQDERGVVLPDRDLNPLIREFSISIDGEPSSQFPREIRPGVRRCRSWKSGARVLRTESCSTHFGQQ